ncbi:alpha/beta hydrolase [Pedobacter sp. N23S346]|uniref:alpha/beta hydrolase n=1 Tax=Pedobacter sp. N23S346 TaxID=3402750 RepID=UPI003AC29021
MKISLFLLFFLVTTISYSQEKNDIPIGKTYKTYSKILGEERPYFVYLPESASEKTLGKQKYPVIYLLDGEQHFQGLAAMMENMGSLRVFQECIIVAIPNIDRIRDFTPTHITSGIFLDSASAKSSGGGEKFTLFLQKELIPEIESKYSTAPYRMLIGHSLGGLFVINTLLKHTELFNSYISIDPALWYDNSKLSKEAENILSDKKFDNKNVFISIANGFKKKLDTAEVRKNITPFNDAVLAMDRLKSALLRNGNKKLLWKIKYYEEEGHNTAPFISEYDGLHYIFRDYNFLSVDNYDLFSTSIEDKTILEALKSGYKQISNSMGYEILPSERIINSIGYAFLRANKLESAYQFFKLNEINHPKSFNVFDAVGDYYSAKGEKKEAKKYYIKALSILDYPETAAKLKALK